MGDSSCNKWFVYILECSDKSLYTGITSDIKRRLREHNSGHGGFYTSALAPVRFLWQEEHPTESEALKREVQIKGWTRKKKKALIQGDVALLKKL